MQTDFQRRPLAIAIAALPFALLFGATDASLAQTPVFTMKEVVVSATRTEQDVDDVAATATTVSAERIEQEMPTDTKDLLRYETGVSVRAQPNRASAVFRATGRSGNEGINVRGLEGDQVLLQIDGVRLPASYSSGPFSAGRADYMDTEAYKRVEILRGPSSTEFGSDGLSGAVSFLTKDPIDLLTLGKDTQGALKVGYSSVDRSWQTAPSFAFRTDNWQGMVLASFRRGHETDNMGSNDVANTNRTTPNPSENKSDYLLTKLIFKPAPAHEFKLTAETLRRRNDTDILSFFGDPYTVSTLTGVNVQENISRDLYKLDYRFNEPNAAWIQAASANIYVQNSSNRQYGFESRSTDPKIRTRDTQYGENVVGGQAQFESYFGKDIVHHVVYGVDISHTEVSSLKQGYNSSGTAFVTNKSFPDTDYDLFGAFIQDEISIANFSVIPGLRYDSFKLTANPDALYTVNNSTATTNLSGHELSPKLGLIWKVSPLANVFAQYAHGFRAPKPSQVNGGVTNLTVSTGSGPYRTIGNPNLKPETSNSIELGIRGHSDTVRYSASIFKSKYKNFIASDVLVESNAAPTPDVYQAVNLSRVDIHGFEARADWVFRPDWALSASYAHTHGDSFTDGVATPLNTIDPDKLVLGLRYDMAKRFGGQLMATIVGPKKRNPDLSYYTPAGYQVYDVSAWYQIDKMTNINAGLFNLFNRKYYHWSDVRDVEASATNIEAYSQPGRNFSLSLKRLF